MYLDKSIDHHEMPTIPLRQCYRTENSTPPKYKSFSNALSCHISRKQALMNFSYPRLPNPHPSIRQYIICIQTSRPIYKFDSFIPQGIETCYHPTVNGTKPPQQSRGPTRNHSPILILSSKREDHRWPPLLLHSKNRGIFARKGC